jgi:tight adherence protein B
MMQIVTIAAAAFSVSCMMLAAFRLLRRAAHPDSLGLLHRTESDLALLFIFVSASQLRVAALAGMILVLGLGWLLDLPWILTTMLAGSMALIPRLSVGWLRHRWRIRLTTQLPDALALWAGLMRAGQAMAPALAQLASRQPNPLGAELKLVLSQYRLGVGLDVAVAQFRDRAAVPDLRMLATLLRAQRELGGNLAEAMERLATLLRTRLAMEARIRSLTAQGRLQGIVVGLLPLLLGAVLSFMEPVAMKSLVTTPVGWAAVALVAALETAGFTMIRRIVNIDV